MKQPPVRERSKQLTPRGWKDDCAAADFDASMNQVSITGTREDAEQARRDQDAWREKLRQRQPRRMREDKRTDTRENRDSFPRRASARRRS